MKNYTITVNGVSYDVTVEEKSGAPSAAPSASASAPISKPSAPSAPAPSSSGDVIVEAPMPGNIIDVKVKVGDSVDAGELLIILEAMKMENEIVSPSAGKIVSVNVTKGESVDAGQVLITLD